MSGYNSICQYPSKTEETFQAQALEIRLPGVNFDPNAAPTTGEEYLTHMAYERNKTPLVVSKRPKQDASEIKNNNIEPKYTACIKSDEELALHVREFANNPNVFLPTSEWKQAQLQNFEEIREKVNSTQSSFTNHSETLVFPAEDEVTGWIEFCQKHPPALSVILQLGQRDLENLLYVFCEWMQSGEEEIEEEDVEQKENAPDKELINALNSDDVRAHFKLTTQWLGQWLYAILACLHLPLEPDVHSNLREIARICVRQRGRLSMPGDEKDIITYNRFILLIAKVFGQLDFADFV